MTEIKNHRDYETFCKNSRESINKIYDSIKEEAKLPDYIKTADDLWVQFTAINPFKFHRLRENAKLYYASLKFNEDYYAEKKKDVDNGFQYLKYFYNSYQEKGFFPDNEPFL